jgi:hypothetical protein
VTPKGPDGPRLLSDAYLEEFMGKDEIEQAQGFVKMYADKLRETGMALPPEYERQSLRLTQKLADLQKTATEENFPVYMGQLRSRIALLEERVRTGPPDERGHWGAILNTVREELDGWEHAEDDEDAEDE